MRFIEVSDRATARKVVDCTQGHNVTLISPIDCAALMGLPWWMAIVRDLKVKSILDCGDSANLAASALRAGLSGVIFRSGDGQMTALQSLAQLLDANVMSERPDTTSSASIIGHEKS